MEEPITEVPTGQFWKRPDQFLLDAGKDGELVIARVRVAVSFALLLVALASYIGAVGAGREPGYIGLGITSAALAISAGIFMVVAADRRQRWLPFATSFFDVSFITLAQLLYAFDVNPMFLLNNRLIFDAYFVALVATCLRFDRRVALSMGLITIAEFVASVLVVTNHFDIGAIADVAAYGRFQWSDQISRVALLAAVTGINVHIVSGLQQQRRLSNADALTGASNRRFLDQFLRNELSRASRHQQPLAVAMVDVDRFKRLNDEFGHAAGDAILRHVARLLHSSVRRTDLIARYGGDEFIIVLPESNAEQAALRMERIKETISGTPLPIERGKARASTPNVKVTLSVGISSWPEDGQLATELIAAADRRMYEEKRQARSAV